MKTDKSGRFMVASPPVYLSMGRIHTAGDKVINMKDARKIQERLNSYCTQLCKIFNVGGHWNHTSKIIDTLTSDSCEVPPMSL